MLRCGCCIGRGNHCWQLPLWKLFTSTHACRSACRGRGCWGMHCGCRGLPQQHLRLATATCGGDSIATHACGCACRGRGWSGMRCGCWPPLQPAVQKPVSAWHPASPTQVPFLPELHPKRCFIQHFSVSNICKNRADSSRRFRPSGLPRQAFGPQALGLLGARPRDMHELSIVTALTDAFVVCRAATVSHSAGNMLF